MSHGLIILIAMVLGHSVAQAIKLSIRLYRKGQVYYGSILEDGDMPSVHSATVSAVTLSVFLFEGISPLFVVTLFFALLTMHDALHIWGLVGRHSIFLNSLGNKQNFKEDTGHSVAEVAVGILVGCVAAVLCYYWL